MNDEVNWGLLAKSKPDPLAFVHIRRLTDILAEHLSWRRARLKFMDRSTTALIQLVEPLPLAS